MGCPRYLDSEFLRKGPSEAPPKEPSILVRRVLGINDPHEATLAHPDNRS